MRTLPLMSVIAVLVCGCTSPADRVADARARLEAASEQVVAEDTSRAAAVAAARAALGPLAPRDPDAPSCGVGSTLALDGPDLVIVNALEADSAPGPRRAAFEAARVRLMADVLLLDQAPSRADATAIGERVDAAVAPWLRDATFVIESRTPPRYTADGGYHAGMIEGSLVVWSYEASRVVCAGRFAATNSPDVMQQARADAAATAAFEQDPVGWLEGDLLRRAFGAALESLVALP